MADDAPLSDYQTLLPPTSTVDLLNASSDLNEKTQASFNDLLRTPFLQEIRAGSLRPNSPLSATPVIEIISEGLTAFSSSQITDVNIVRKLSGFAGTVPRLAAALPRGRLAEVLTGMLSRYAEFANKKSVEAKKFHNELAAVIASTSDAISAMDADLDVLREDLEVIRDEANEDENDGFALFSFFRSSSGRQVLDTTRRRLRKYLHGDVSSEQALVSTLAVCFSVSSDELVGVVGGGDSSSPDVSRYLELLTDFQTRLRDVRLLMTALLNNLRQVLRQSVQLMSTWYILLQNIAVLRTSDEAEELFGEDEVTEISEAWESLKADAEAFTKSVSDVSSTAVNTLLEKNVEIVRRSLHFSARSVAPREETELTPEDNEALEKITTDEQTLAALEAMTASSGKIVGTFNKLLQIPFLDSLHVSAAASGTKNDGSDETEGQSVPGAKIDLETLTLNFLQRYQKLQADTVPVARNLYAYALLQQRLIPMLDSSLSIENYVRVNLGVIEKRREEAERVHALHNKFQQDWNTAILMVERAIGEQEANVDTIKAQIKDLIKQKKNMTLGAALSFLGAAVFTAAAFFTGGMVMVFMGAAAVGLVVSGSLFAAESAKLQKSIEGYRAALKSAEETLSQLKIVLPVMIEIREHLKSITLVWNDITLKLADLSTGTEAWEILAFVLQGDEWDPFMQSALDSWKGIERNVLQYVRQVSDVNPTID